MNAELILFALGCAAVIVSLQRLSFRAPSAPSPKPGRSRYAEERFAPQANTASAADVAGGLDEDGRLPFAQKVRWLVCFAIVGWGVVIAIGLLMRRLIH